MLLLLLLDRKCNNRNNSHSNKREEGYFYIICYNLIVILSIKQYVHRCWLVAKKSTKNEKERLFCSAFLLPSGSPTKTIVS